MKMKIKKKNFDYFECLVNMSQYALEEANLLRDILTDFDPDKVAEQRMQMHALEHQCDTEKHEMTTALVKEFLPPVDRDDLATLSHVTDDLTDSVESVVAFLYMANIRRLRPDVGAFADLIIECCENAVLLLKEFRNFKKSDKLKDIIIKLNDLEEQGDRLYAEAVRRLSTEELSTRDVIEWRDMYKNFEECFDAAESIADNVESVVMKNT